MAGSPTVPDTIDYTLSFDSAPPKELIDSFADFLNMAQAAGAKVTVLDGPGGGMEVTFSFFEIEKAVQFGKRMEASGLRVARLVKKKPPN